MSTGHPTYIFFVLFSPPLPLTLVPLARCRSRSTSYSPSARGSDSWGTPTALVTKTSSSSRILPCQSFPRQGKCNYAARHSAKPTNTTITMLLWEIIRLALQLLTARVEMAPWRFIVDCCHSGRSVMPMLESDMDTKRGISYTYYRPEWSKVSKPRTDHDLDHLVPHLAL